MDGRRVSTRTSTTGGTTARSIPGLQDDTGLGLRAVLRLLRQILPGTTSSTRLPPTDIYYQNIFDKTVKQKAMFGELTYDLTEKWSVTGGARWFEYDRHEVDISYVPRACRSGTRTPARIVTRRTASLTAHSSAGASKARHGQRHRLQVRDPVQVRRRPDGVSAVQRGVPPRRQQRARAAATG